MDDEDRDTEVPQDHERAKEFDRGGKLQIKLDGETRAIWVRTERREERVRPVNQTVSDLNNQRLSHTTFIYHHTRPPSNLIKKWYIPLLDR